jgi:alpha-mannosidase
MQNKTSYPLKNGDFFP